MAQSANKREGKENITDTSPPAKKPRYIYLPSTTLQGTELYVFRSIFANKTAKDELSENRYDRQFARP